ncbi:sulfite exporter TauE/SafE family protein [Tsukamurella sp. 1534]|uniref:sulfite exporter TauE/SafE family protein n=1 Tax=Tsukamurella sp. 1534 TaxID=1151061 RepID=UPI0002E12273|nr:sulfite exporter TauE/SafE family protein [Tsukamurella sp. 1534]
MSSVELVLVCLAGFAAGLIGFLTGLASIVSYPALLAVGLPPVAANVTNTVAMVAVGGGSVANSVPELSEDKPRMARLALVALVGGAAGAAILLVAPGESFAAVVPVLVAIAAVAILVQPRLRALAGERTFPVLYYGGVFLAAVYGGYFGAGAGVMILAITLVCTTLPMWRAVIEKSFALGVANLVAAIAFAVFGPVHWPAAIALAVGGFAGGWCGPPVAERVDQDLLRRVVGVCGLALAAWLARTWF